MVKTDMARSAPERPSVGEMTEILGLHRVLPMAYAGLDMQSILDDRARRIAQGLGRAAALMDTSMILQSLSRSDEAAAILRDALQLSRDYCVVHGDGSGIKVLAIVTAGDFMANTPVDFLLNGSNAILWLRYVDETANFEKLPDHDVAILAIGEAQAHAPILAHVKGLLCGHKKPILNNDPAMIAALTRDGVSNMLADEPSIVAPLTRRLGREELQAATAAGSTSIGQTRFPLIVRPIGTHAGFGLERVDGPADLASYLQGEPGDWFYIAPFIDYRGRDGLFCKQRVVFINGRPFASHLALSDHWIVHYLSAGMTEDAEKRAIEAAWMRDFDTDFAQRHATSFAALNRHVGLDYFGIDCAELPDGRLLVFELDIAMVVHDMDDKDIFPYKHTAMKKLFDAFVIALEGLQDRPMADAA